MLQQLFVIDLYKGGVRISRTPSTTYYPKEEDIERAINESNAEWASVEKVYTVMKEETKRSTLDLREELKGFHKDLVKQQLVLAAEEKRYVYVDEFLRGIGKTTALIEYAREIGATIIVPNSAIATWIKSAYDVDVVTSINLRGSIPEGKPVVFDEGINPLNLSKLNLNIKTGFVNKK